MKDDGFGIGNTSFVEIKNIVNSHCKLFAKCEFENPTGSHKDRVYLSIIEGLESRSVLRPGMTLVDFTSGNGGVALARLGKLKGYKIKVVIPSQVSPEKIQDIRRCDGEIIPIKSYAQLGYINAEDLLKARLAAGRIAQENGYYFLDQANNPLNKEGCKRIGEEIIAHCKINNIMPDCIVCGIGTGGTISGVSEVLKRKFPNIKAIGVEPYESNTVQANLLGKSPRHKGHNLSGLGMGAITANIVLKYIDDTILVRQEEWLEMMAILRYQGYSVGKTSAASAVAIGKYASMNDSCHTAIAIFSDLAWKYETELRLAAKSSSESKLVERIGPPPDKKNRYRLNGIIMKEARSVDKSYVRSLVKDLQRRGITSICSLPCGDFNTESHLASNGIKVKGYCTSSLALRKAQNIIEEEGIIDCSVESRNIFHDFLGHFDAAASFLLSQEISDDLLLVFLDNLCKSLPMGGVLYMTFPAFKYGMSMSNIEMKGEDTAIYDDDVFMRPRDEMDIRDLISKTCFSIRSLHVSTLDGGSHANEAQRNPCLVCYFAVLEKAYHTVGNAIEAVKCGIPIIIADHRENEGDLYIASEKANSENINFLLRGRGVLCVSMSQERMKELEVRTADELRMNLNDTRFGMPVDYLPGCLSGVSAKDRAATVKAITLPSVKSSDFLKNGHVRTLEAMDGGLSVRQGHCEASMELAQLASLYPSGAMCELLNEKGDMMREEELINFSREHQICIIKINQLIEFKQVTNKTVINGAVLEKDKAGQANAH